MKTFLCYLLSITAIIFLAFCASPEPETVLDQIPEVHTSGLMMDDHLGLVVANCLSCHSAALITQNRATKAGWNDMIDWMQESQGLHDLGENHEAIVDYLTKYYAPVEQGRRAVLQIDSTEWYEL